MLSRGDTSAGEKNVNSAQNRAMICVHSKQVWGKTAHSFKRKIPLFSALKNHPTGIGKVCVCVCVHVCMCACMHECA